MERETSEKPQRSDLTKVCGLFVDQIAEIDQFYSLDLESIYNILDNTSEIKPELAASIVSNIVKRHDVTPSEVLEHIKTDRKLVTEHFDLMSPFPESSDRVEKIKRYVDKQNCRIDSIVDRLNSLEDQVTTNDYMIPVSPKLDKLTGTDQRPKVKSLSDIVESRNDAFGKLPTGAKAHSRIISSPAARSLSPGATRYAPRVTNVIGSPPKMMIDCEAMEMERIMALSSTININKCDLFKYSKLGDLNRVKCIIYHKRKLVRARNHRDRCLTALHYACMYGHRDVAEFLILYGACVDAKSEDSNAPIHYAAYRGYTEIVMLLINRGACIKVRSCLGKTPLHYAAIQGHFDIVRLLLLEGCPVDGMDKEGMTALHYACINNRKSVVDYLVIEGADINAKDLHQNTPLTYSLENSNKVISYFLSTKGGIQ